MAYQSQLCSVVGLSLDLYDSGSGRVLVQFSAWSSSFLGFALPCFRLVSKGRGLTCESSSNFHLASLPILEFATKHDTPASVHLSVA